MRDSFRITVGNERRKDLGFAYNSSGTPHEHLLLSIVLSGSGAKKVTSQLNGKQMHCNTEILNQVILRDDQVHESWNHRIAWIERDLKDL